jgi:hypothetical protein
MSLQEKIRQVKAEICDNRRQIAHVRLESLAGSENPYSLMQVFWRRHQVTWSGANVYVTHCQALEVVPRQHLSQPMRYRSCTVPQGYSLTSKGNDIVTKAERSFDLDFVFDIKAKRTCLFQNL